MNLKSEKIVIVDFGGQYSQLIARKIREMGVYSWVVSYENAVQKIKEEAAGGAVKGIIFTGGPNSVYAPDSPSIAPEVFELGIPVLGICYGMQLMAHVLGGEVKSAEISEYGKTEVLLDRGGKPAASNGSDSCCAASNGVGSGSASCGAPSGSAAASDPDSCGADACGAPTSSGADSRGTDACGADISSSAAASDSLLYAGISGGAAFMSHTDYVSRVPACFRVTSHTKDCATTSMEDAARGLYAVQYHPEVTHTVFGEMLFENFLFRICGCSRTWQITAFVSSMIEKIRETVGGGKVLCALSGGVDSSVVASMLSKAIGRQLTCVFVDHGLMRKNEAAEVKEIFSNFDMNFVAVDAAQRFYKKLEGVTEPERKRKIIGEEFIRVFEEEAKKIGAVDFLAQGTIYPDIIESGIGKSAVIKSHHNVGGLPDIVDFKEIIEPLRELFKDEVRKVGLELGLPESLVYRQPFPGPGLGVRIIGEITAEKVKTLQDADAIYREEIARFGLDRSISQYFAALSNMRSVGVKGDFRTYDYAVVLRAVSTLDFMTAEAVHLPWELLDTVTSRIINEVSGINRVLYDCTSKPPGTIEME